MTQLRQKREEDKSKEAGKLKGKEALLKEFDAKIEEKENCYFRLNYKSQKRYNRTKMLKERKTRENSYNDKHFEMKLNGIHGAELPSFYQTNKEWWKVRDGYKQNPKNASHCQLVQDNKFWSRNDMILLADFTTEEGPQDSFKANK